MMVDSRVVAPPTTVVGARAFVVTFSAAIALIIFFLLLDTALARLDDRENARQAAHEYEEGRAALARGDASTAREHFASAVATQRGNATFMLGLADAMIADGRFDAAEQTLTAVLDREGNSGAANLVMARLLARRGRGAEATVYFHRAIVGRWDGDSIARRTKARFELIDLLAAQHDEQAMLGELLPLEASFPDSVPLKRRLAHLFIRAGAASRGIPILRDLLRANANDADAYVGLGEAALTLGNFVTARADLAQAARLRTDDAHIAARLAVADTILAIDPEMRRLSSVERETRARILLARTISEVSRCGDARRHVTVVDSARVLVSNPLSTTNTADELIKSAVALGPLISTHCVDGDRRDEVVAVLLRQLDR